MLRLFDTAIVSPRGLGILSHMVTLKGDPGHLHVTEQIVVENLSDKTVIGSKQQGFITFGLSIPEGASEVKIDSKDADTQLVILGKAKKSFAVSKPILPQLAGGNPLNNAVTVSYELKWKRNIDLSRRVLYPTKYFAIARGGADKETLLITAPQLGEARKPEVAMGASADSLVNAVGRPMSATPVFKGAEMLQIQITRKPKPIIWMFFALTALLCVFVPGAMLWSRKARRAKPIAQHIEYSNQPSDSQRVAKSAEPLQKASVYTGTYPQNDASVAPNRELHPREPQSSEALIEEIAVLDDCWENRQISQEEYQSQRALLKQQLVAAMRAVKL